MNREIKFRAWDRGNDRSITRMFDVKVIDFKSAVLFESDRRKFHDLNHCHLMQFIGLKDKNGKEIYEGDCIRYIGAKDYYRVEWSDDAGIWIGRHDQRDQPAAVLVKSQTVEVIGNIYENPDLLK